MPPLPAPGSPGSAVLAVRRWLTGTLAGRALLLGAAVKLLALLLRAGAPGSGVVEAIDTIGDIGLVIAAALLAYRAYVAVKDVLLWRVRRKLILSYMFIGFVPVLLIIILFVTSGLILFFNISQYVASGGVRTLVNQASYLAEFAAVGLQGATSESEVRERLLRRQIGAVRAFPYLSFAIVPANGTCSTEPVRPRAFAAVMTAGPWAHIDPPSSMPPWVPCSGTAGLMVYGVDAPGAPDDGGAHIVARAVAWPDNPELPFAVVVDLPFSSVLVDRVRRETGIDIGAVTADATCEAGAARGRIFERDTGARDDVGASGLWHPLTSQLEWVTFLGYFEWSTGEPCRASMQIGMTIADLYSRISATPVTTPEGLDLGQGLLVILAFVGFLFFVIQFVASVMGLALARSITSAVHELGVGTERVRRGDFTDKIPIRSRDQLGDLADSFNSMTSSIEDLLRQKAEKERLEEELRIARNIQMSLLPQGQITFPGLSLSAHCEPAREVGGDYYDYFPIDDHRLGMLIADVAGKGTSAALYMAELKGIMLSLSRRHTSPRSLLVDANRILARHLDRRSFITITYGVFDLHARTLTYARAGHCPLIYVPGPYARERAAQVHTPDGLVLGLQIDDGERFESLLTEATLLLGPGDLILLYTDGLTEAMDADGECFGDARLAALMQEHADQPFEELRERILREIGAFSGTVVQQDDMTMLLMKVQEPEPGLAEGLASAGAVSWASR